MQQYIEYAVRLRQVLHLCPEASMHEMQTRTTLIEYLRTHTDLEILDHGSWFTASWRTPEGGAVPTIALRADFDAVSTADGTCRHLCGHDGHSAILAAFGRWLSDHRPAANVHLIFQPGEETGEGARLCCDLFRREQIDAIYGFHNIPGFPAGVVLLRDGTFACASTGLSIRMHGSPSHAAYPENGKNPSAAIAHLILDIEEYLRAPHRGMVLSTVIGVDLGSHSYGVSAYEGTLRLTIRAEYQQEFDQLLAYIRQRADQLAQAGGLSLSIDLIEAFPATENHSLQVQHLRTLAERASLPQLPMEEPRRWSEDFGWYLKECPGAFFGIGAGEDWPQLHTEEYEFNDAIIGNVLSLYRELIQ